MRKTILRLAALSLVALLALAPTAGAQSKTATVTIQHFAFHPSHITVAPGTTVTWVNKDKTAHTVTATRPAKAFASGKLMPGRKFSFKFDLVGAFFQGLG
jgi:plastocyanin